ncbi:MAG: ABC transporter permease [Bacteroidetes bacterium]|nr:ABC transporter permease [Bacteroidota bacterium]
MLKNYFKTAWRNLVRNKAFSFINISGLALGIACSLLIMLWVQDERSVDAFHKNGKDLYQVYERNYFDGKVQADYPTQGLLGEELKRVIPEVKYASGLEHASAPGSMTTFAVGEKINKMDGQYAGEDFFRMFSFPLLQGSASTALKEPGNIAISRRMAESFFGSTEKAIGQPIVMDNANALKISAVFENIPANSSLQFDFLLTWKDFVKENNWVNNWGNTSPQTFVQLRSDANAANIEPMIKDFIYRYQQKNASFLTELALQPFPEKYLHSTFTNGKIDGGRIEYVRLFTVVAIFLLLIACINFMNLATAQSARRAKEVGLRKVVGAMRASLIRQFIGEAMLLTFFAVLIALAAATMILPAFNMLTGKQLYMPVSNPVFWIYILGLLFVTGVVAGSYPALFLSSLNPVTVLKGTLKFNWGATFFRKGLVVFQFTLSIILIVSMVVIYRQVNYIQTKNLGYARENLLYLPIEGELIKKYEVFKDEALKLPDITDVSKMRNSPTVIEHHTGDIFWEGKDPNLTISFADGVVGYDFVKTMKLQLKDGRDFSKDYSSDSVGFLLNETAANKIGFKNAVGQTMVWGKHPGKVIGVLKDFHFNSMHQNIDPLIVRLDENWPWGTILIRTKAGKTKEAIAGLEKLCKTLNPEIPFTFQFSDLEFSKLYRSEEIVSQLANYFAVIAIFISCLGLFGLATFTAAQRTKEIGVRKVLGASVPDIVAMLSNNFLRLVLLSMLIAFPVAWFAMNKWLQNFAYKINIDWWVFAIAGAATILIALITVSYQSIKAAIANPVKSLRSE